MVTVKYFEDSTRDEAILFHVDRLVDFIREVDLPKSEFVFLDYFHDNVLGERINTEDGNFIFIDEGVITVINRKSIPSGPAVLIPIAVGLIVAVLSYAIASRLAGQISVDDDSASQTSATNSLGTANNQFPSVGDRIDDLFGKVVKHVPKFWQTPYRIGVNDQETEIQYLCISRGALEINAKEIYDNTTRFINIPGASVDIYGPNTYPGNGSPEVSSGNVIDREIGIITEHSGLGSPEMVPPNDLDLGSSASWSVSGDGEQGTFTLNNASSLDVDLTEYFAVGQVISAFDTELVVSDSSVDIYYIDDSESPPVEVYESINGSASLTNISGDYEVLSVTSDTLVVDGFLFDFSTSLISRTVTSIKNSAGAFLLYTSESIDTSKDWRLQSDDELISYAYTTIDYDIGQVFDNTVGPFVLDDGTEKIICNLTSFSGFYKISGSSYLRVSANVRFVVQELDDDELPTGNQVTTNVTYDSNSSSSEKSVYRTFEIEIPYDKARVYASRTSNRDLSDGITNVDKIEWSLLYSFKSLPEDTDLGDVTTMHCLIPSNSQSRLVTSRKTNVTCIRKITEYLGDGEFGPKESFATSSADQIMIHTALDERCGRLTLDDINADNLLLLREQVIEYSGDESMFEFGYVFDTTQMSYDDMFSAICDVVACLPYMRESKYDAFHEGEQLESTIQITHRNKIPGTEKRTDDFEKKYDGVELTYRSNDEDGTNITIYVPEDRSAVTPETKTLSGCFNEIQAQQYADRMYNKQIYQRTTVTFDTDEFGRMITPGQRIDSPDSTRFNQWSTSDSGYKVYDGEVIEVNGLSVELSQPVTFTEGENHYIRFTNYNGDNSKLIQCYEREDEFLVTLAEAPDESIYDGYNRDRTKYTFSSEQLRGSMALVPYEIDISVDEEANEVVTIAMRNYNGNIYKNDVRNGD